MAEKKTDVEQIKGIFEEFQREDIVEAISEMGIELKQAKELISSLVESPLEVAMLFADPVGFGAKRGIKFTEAEKKKFEELMAAAQINCGYVKCGTRGAAAAALSQ